MVSRNAYISVRKNFFPFQNFHGLQFEFFFLFLFLFFLFSFSPFFIVDYAQYIVFLHNDPNNCFVYFKFCFSCFPFSCLLFILFTQNIDIFRIDMYVCVCVCSTMGICMYVFAQCFNEDDASNWVLFFFFFFQFPKLSFPTTHSSVWRKSFFFLFFLVHYYNSIKLPLLHYFSLLVWFHFWCKSCTIQIF